MRLQREMARVEEMHFRAGVVALVSLRPRRQEERIVFAPDGEQRWALGGEIGLELGIERDIARIVEEEVELDVVIARPREQR